MKQSNIYVIYLSVLTFTIIIICFFVYINCTHDFTQCFSEDHLYQ